MKRYVVFACALLMGIGAWSSQAQAANYVIYLHGRSMTCWTGQDGTCSSTNRNLASVAGWTNVTMSYNGSASLADTSVDTNIRNTVSAYCGGSNQCVIHCYSAGCSRALKAVADLRAMNQAPTGLLWMQASGSAAGGTPLANLSTKGLTKFIAKILGLQERIDFDITPDAARNRWGYMQGAFGKTVYHVAGNVDVCKSLAGILKICTNTFIANGAADGLVPFSSAAGCSDTGWYSDGCACSKYAYRSYDSSAPGGCAGVPRDHMGIHETGTARVASRLAGSYADKGLQWSDSSLPSTSCSNSTGTCDNAFVNANAKFCILPNGTQVAGCDTSTSSVSTGNTTASCAAHCGGNYVSGGVTYWCDPVCAKYGNCGADYATSNCANVLATVRQPVHRGYNTGTSTHFFTHDLQQLAQNASVEQLNAFYVYGSSIVQGATMALYRCSIAGKYLLTSRSDCWDPVRSAYGSGATLVGYTSITAWDSSTGNPTTPLYEMYNNGDRVYTTSSSEKSTLTSQGWSNPATWYAWSN